MALNYSEMALQQKEEAAWIEKRKNLDLLLDEHVAVMTQQVFDSLAEYSTTIPTGTFIGKIWKRNVNVYSSASPVPEWYLGEYVPSDLPDQIGIRWRAILIV